jgi:hypothetical protein
MIPIQTAEVMGTVEEEVLPPSYDRPISIRLPRRRSALRAAVEPTTTTTTTNEAAEESVAEVSIKALMGKKLVHNVLHRVEHSKNIESLNSQKAKAINLLKEFAAANAEVENITELVGGFVATELEPVYKARLATMVDLKGLMGPALIHNVLHRVQHCKTLKALEKEMAKSRAILADFVTKHEASIPMIGEIMQKSFIATELEPTYETRKAEITAAL